MKLDNNFQSDSLNGGFQEMSKSRKITIFSLIFLMIAVMVLGLWQLRARVFNPFKAPQDDSYQLARSDQLNENVDTDGDGLSDYNETFLYGTSPYREDTDSDGISDYEEVMRGSDPKCPVGGDCLDDEFFFEPENTFNKPLGDLEAGLGEISLPENIDDVYLQQVLAGEINVDDLRALLLESGADADMLSQVSDEELIASYQEVLNNQNEQ